MSGDPTIPAPLVAHIRYGADEVAMALGIGSSLSDQVAEGPTARQHLIGHLRVNAADYNRWTHVGVVEAVDRISHAIVVIVGVNTVGSAVAVIVGCTARRAQRIGATSLLGAAEEMLKAIGAVLEPESRAVYEYGTVSALARLGEVAFEHARQEGRAMSVEEAVACALRETPRKVVLQQV